VFNANCAACHAGGQNSVVADHTLEKAAIEKFLTGGFKESSVVTQVRCAPPADPVPIELRRSPATTLLRIFVVAKIRRGLWSKCLLLSRQQQVRGV
jgi:Fe2+ transport system protein FeoA